jgi:hypothetical protein
MSPLSSFIADLLEDYQQAVPIEVVPDNARLLASQSERTMVAAVASSAPPPISEKKEYCRWTAKQQDEALLPPSDLSYAELSMDEILGKAVQLFPSTSL